MLPGPHLIAGAVIATKIGSFSWPVIVLALLSHIILDIIPHRDVVDENNLLSKGQLIVLAIDFLVVVLLVYVFFKNNLALALFGAFFAMLPDLIEQSSLIFPRIKQNKSWRLFNKWHGSIQKVKPSWILGALTQVVVIVLMLWML